MGSRGDRRPSVASVSDRAAGQGPPHGHRRRGQHRDAERLEVSRSTVHGRRQGFAGHGVDWVGKVRPGRGPKPTASQDRIEKMVHDTLHSARRRLPVPLEGPALGGGRSHDNTAERAGRATRARKARRRRATPPERTSTPCASSANVPPRARRRPMRSHRWRGRSASGRSRSGVGREADIDEGRSRGDLERGRTNP